jgi:hypothetical protein
MTGAPVSQHADQRARLDGLMAAYAVLLEVAARAEQEEAAAGTAAPGSTPPVQGEGDPTLSSLLYSPPSVAAAADEHSLGAESRPGVGTGHRRPEDEEFRP